MNLVSGWRCLAATCLLLSLAACSERGSGGGSGGAIPTGPSVVTSINADSADLVTRSSLDMIGKMVVVGNITNRMVEEGAGLLTAGIVGGAFDIPECDNIGHGPSTNRISYLVTASGNLIPPGPRLDVGLLDCTLEGVEVNGMLYIAGITRSGDPSGSGDWSLAAEIVLGPVDISNGDSTFMSITDKFRYTADMQNGILTTTMAMAADAGAGQIGGLNAQHCLDSSCGSSSINYQLRPFYIVLTEDSNTGEYTVAVPAANQVPTPPEGDSLLDRYTTSPNAEIKLRVGTTEPILWQGGRPTALTDTPAAGEIRFTETDCSSCGNIIATVEPDGVSLTVSDGSTVTTQSSAWSSLLTAPDYN